MGPAEAALSPEAWLPPWGGEGSNVCECGGSPEGSYLLRFQSCLGTHFWMERGTW